MGVRAPQGDGARGGGEVEERGWPEGAVHVELELDPGDNGDGARGRGLEALAVDESSGERWRMARRVWGARWTERRLLELAGTRAQREQCSWRLWRARTRNGVEVA